jgi:hypothetical protein
MHNNPKLSNQKKEPRISNEGVHGHDGEDSVYSAKLTLQNFNKVREFYIKCFFWTKADKQSEQGVEIQSFKEWE